MTKKTAVLAVRTQLRQRLAPPPDWLQKSWDGAKRRGLDKLSMDAIDTEIAAYRREKRKSKVKPKSGQ